MEFVEFTNFMHYEENGEIFDIIILFERIEKFLSEDLVEKNLLQLMTYGIINEIFEFLLFEIFQ
jgi:hypothetical protein